MAPALPPARRPPARPSIHLSIHLFVQVLDRCLSAADDRRPIRRSCRRLTRPRVRVSARSRQITSERRQLRRRRTANGTPGYTYPPRPHRSPRAGQLERFPETPTKKPPSVPCTAGFPINLAAVAACLPFDGR